MARPRDREPEPSRPTQRGARGREQWGARHFGRVAGFYSGGWAFRVLGADDKVALAEYWDSELVTRYVEGVYTGRWRLVTLGERIRDYSRVVVGRECSREEFLNAVRK